MRHTSAFSCARPTNNTPSVPANAARNCWATSSLRSLPKDTNSSPRAAMKPWMSATNALVIGSINAVDA
ncbi:hypothetical protein [Mycolicibacterium doricum]|uniref:hypothetical protein n=1 Tax=Mycolicibacterium doricum TaxID=126673 RepID=UPI001FD58CF2|nr:hypothetical protein [Mycolicibacterium doricum]